MSLARLRPESVAVSAVPYASVTEQVALEVVRLEGSGTPEKAYTLATEVFREELGKVGVSGRVAILREERLDERGEVRSLKTRPGILSVGDILGGGWTEVDLAVEPVEGLHLPTRGQQGAISAVAASPRGSMLRTPDMYMSKLIVGPREGQNRHRRAGGRERTRHSRSKRPENLGDNLRGARQAPVREPHRADKGDRRAHPDPPRGRPDAGHRCGPARIGVARYHRYRGGSRGRSGRSRYKMSRRGDPGQDVVHTAFVGREAQGVRPRRPGAEAGLRRLDPGRRRGLLGDGHHAGGDPARGEVLPGRRPDAHRGHVNRTPYGTIHGHHSRPRARRRDTGLPTLAAQTRNA
jgi:Bacterial fructose-1,6-bisphosphatase, glpX-encoded